MHFLRIAILPALFLLQANAVRGGDELEQFFEKSIRPILAEHCWQCHGAEKQWNSLRLDSAQALQRGGDSGAVFISGNATDSLLIKAVERSGDLQMPPDQPLQPEQVELLRQWINSGAPWPKSSVTTDQQAWKNHWAFQPLKRVEPPSVETSQKWCRNPIDQFVLQGLHEHNMQPSEEADRQTLIRRATYCITGLPPTYQQVQAFIADPRPDAYECLVDELLESPRYGEHLGRMWLDVARYSDTKGYVYAREERFFVNAALYRDWVIGAFNSDMPYDQFLKLQIAADQVAPGDPKALAAMGLLTLGRRFLGVTHDIIDDRIDVIGRGTMGLTISCARCHDHKYDPIPTADYYSLYGVFQCSTDRQVDLSAHSNQQHSAEYSAELDKRLKALADKTAVSRKEAGQRVRGRIADYLFAQTELQKYGEEGFDVVLATTDIIPAFVRRWEGFLAQRSSTQDPVFAPWLSFSALGVQNFAAQSDTIWQACRQQSELHPLVAELLATKPDSLRELADRYGRLFALIDQRSSEYMAKPEQQRSEEERTWFESTQPFRDVLYGPTAPCEVPDEEVISTETFFDSATCNELWKLQGEVDRWRLKFDGAPQLAVAVFDRATLVEPRIFRRGNPANKGPRISRHFPSLFSSSAPEPFSKGSGRLELAEKIVDPNNPLTPRVWVNRLWQHHFGQALVTTPSDFGLRAQPPSHPELLDWLAQQLIESGWSSKSIQRTMLLSATFRQSSSSDGELQKSFDQLDPQNRWLWKMNSRRLSFEELRDSLLAASGDLQHQIGGKARELFSKDDSNRRRTVYGLVDRQFLPSTLRVFDFANPDLHIGRRSQTQVPQQSLYFLNHPLVAARAVSLVAKIPAWAEASRASTPSLEEQVVMIYRHALKRDPGPSELEDAILFASQPQESDSTQPSSEALTWSYGYGEVDEGSGRLKTFNSLPYFSGGAWQGGSQYPDGKLGWVQLTATGGHPGNDLKHACVRRWTAPRAMSVCVRSTAKHEPDVSDGVRCRILSSRHGVLAESRIKASASQIDVEKVELQAGDTLDFVTDILGELSHDQHAWAPTIERLSIGSESNSSADSSAKWDAKRDFFGPANRQLNRLEQLAQVLLSTNEFTFVD